MRIASLLVSVLGRQHAWRLGRALYMEARGEVPNSLNCNGEKNLVEILAGHWSLAGVKSPVIVDCGANIGDWSAMTLGILSSCRIDAKLHLFEPAPVAIDALRTRFSGNREISLHQLALAEQLGEVDFFLTSPTGGRNGLSEPLEGDVSETVRIKAVRGDQHCTSFGVEHIHLLKIDAEGHDFAVIAGFEAMLAQQKIDVVQFEYNARWLSSHKCLRDIQQFVHPLGYCLGCISERQIQVFSLWNPELDRFFERNYLLLSPHMQKMLAVTRVRWTRYNTFASE